MDCHCRPKQRRLIMRAVSQTGQCSVLCMQVGVGRLGIITKLVMTILPNGQVKRRLQELTIQELIDQVKQTQQDYVNALALDSAAAIQAALDQLDETQVPITIYCAYAPTNTCR